MIITTKAAFFFYMFPRKIKLLTLQWMVGAARTQAPSATNNDAGSPAWGDLKLSTPP